MNFDLINNKAKEFFDQKDFKSALDLLNRPDLPLQLIPNLAKCYYYTSKADKALELILPLEKTQDLWIDTALYYNAIGNHEKAFEIYKTLDLADYKVKFNIGWHYLRNNEFKKGFEFIQHGDKCRVWGHEYIYVEQGKLDPKKKWKGNKVDKLLFFLEGGQGDEIIFLRWANYLSTMCNELIILCSFSLTRLLTNSNYNVLPNVYIDNVEYDEYVPAMSLPAIAGFDSPKQHVTFPYITSFTDKFIVKQMDLLANGRKKIGVKFFGNPQFEHDQFRSPPRHELEKLSIYGQLFSLQIDEEESTIPNVKHYVKDWQDTYSIFKGLDILVTSCTSTAHLAGAMGIKAFVLVPLVPYFVWASDDLKWYEDNITVIRQTKYNDWSEAIERLNYELSKLCSV